MLESGWRENKKELRRKGQEGWKEGGGMVVGRRTKDRERMEGEIRKVG